MCAVWRVFKIRLCGSTDLRWPLAAAVVLMSRHCVYHKLHERNVHSEPRTTVPDGPTLSGLSPGVVDALIYSIKEMAASKLCLEDCSDVQHRQTIRLVSEEK